MSYQTYADHHITPRTTPPADECQIMRQPAALCGCPVCCAARLDPLYDQAVEIVLRTRTASTQSVQRHLLIGYNRASRLLEQMEAAGLVSAMDSEGQRLVLNPGGLESEGGEE